MTDLLQQAINKVAQLPEDQQSVIAQYISSLLDDDDGPFVPLADEETLQAVTPEMIENTRKSLGLL